MVRDGGGTLRYLTHSGIETGVWYHFVGTYDGITYRSYINGEDMKSRTDGFQGLGTADFMIGSYSTGDYFFRGSIDDVRVYNRGLSSQEISSFYARTKGKYLTDKR